MAWVAVVMAPKDKVGRVYGPFATKAMAYYWWHNIPVGLDIGPTKQILDMQLRKLHAPRVAATEEEAKAFYDEYHSGPMSRAVLRAIDEANC